MMLHNHNAFGYKLDSYQSLQRTVGQVVGSPRNPGTLVQGRCCTTVANPRLLWVNQAHRDLNLQANDPTEHGPGCNTSDFFRTPEIQCQVHAPCLVRALLVAPTSCFRVTHVCQLPSRQTRVVAAARAMPCLCLTPFGQIHVQSTIPNFSKPVTTSFGRPTFVLFSWYNTTSRCYLHLLVSSSRSSWLPWLV